MSHLSPQARAAQDLARRTNGQFGSSPRHEAVGSLTETPVSDPDDPTLVSLMEHSGFAGGRLSRKATGDPTRERFVFRDDTTGERTKITLHNTGFTIKIEAVTSRTGREQRAMEALSARAEAHVVADAAARALARSRAPHEPRVDSGSDGHVFRGARDAEGFHTEHAHRDAEGFYY